MKKLWCIIWIALVLIPAGAVHGQQRFDPREMQKARELFPILQSDLRNYVTAQESFFADSMRYASSIGSLTRSPVHYQASPGVLIIVLTATDKAYSAVAIHTDLPDYPCAVRVGPVPPPLNDEAGEGEPTCRWPG
jgi:hypothetical protein